MRKTLLTSLLALTLCAAGKAQDLRLGVTGGYNLSRGTAYDSRSGFRAGVQAELGWPQAVRGLYLGFGLQLSSGGWTQDGYYDMAAGGSLSWQSTHYALSVPLHVGYKLPVSRRAALFVSAGPYFGLGLFGKTMQTFAPDAGAATTRTLAGNVFADGYMRRFDWGLGFRAGVEVVRRVQLAVGHDWGLQNVGRRGVDYKNRTFTASLAYLF